MAPTRHGHSGGRGFAASPTYRTWKAMLMRCRNPNHKAYARYGGRGIAVCDRWLVFENFLEDVGERPKGLTIDRIDNDRGYEPGNVRWLSLREQGRHRAGVSLDSDKAAEIRTLSRDGVALRELAARFNTSLESIQEVISGRTWNDAHPRVRRRMQSSMPGGGPAAPGSHGGKTAAVQPAAAAGTIPPGGHA